MYGESTGITQCMSVAKVQKLAWQTGLPEKTRLLSVQVLAQYSPKTNF